MNEKLDLFAPPPFKEKKQKKGGTSGAKDHKSEYAVPISGQNPEVNDLDQPDPKPLDMDYILHCIKEYNGGNPDFISLRKNFIKTGHNGTFYKRAVLNTLNFIKWLEGLK